jgi:hypothetical protein
MFSALTIQNLQFESRYEEIYGNGSAAATRRRNKKNTKITSLLMEVDSSNDDTEDEAEDPGRRDARKPWQKDFWQYLDNEEVLASTMSMVAWWGVSLLLRSDVLCADSGSPMRNATLFGQHWPSITCQLWHPLFQRSVRSLLPALL